MPSIEAILVVDDDPAARTLIRAMLTEEGGYGVREASDGATALAELEAAPADLVLTDLQMPGMHGLKLLQEVRRLFPGTGVVVFSGMGTDGQGVECLQAGALDSLPKPFGRKDLLAAVRAALQRRRSSPGMDVRYEKAGWLELTADSDFETVERFRSFVQRLAEARVPEELLQDLRFAIDELGRNAVEWGNRGEKGKRVHFSYCLLEGKMMLKIEDEGAGFDPGAVPDPSSDPGGSLRKRRVEGKRAGGFGIHLVRKLMDEVIYNERGNVVIMTKYLGAG